MTAPKANNIGSGDCKLDGNNPITQIHTPTTQTKLISWDERRRMMRSIKGRLKNGIMMPLTIPKV